MTIPIIGGGKKPQIMLQESGGVRKAWMIPFEQYANTILQKLPDQAPLMQMFAKVCFECIKTDRAVNLTDVIKRVDTRIAALEKLDPDMARKALEELKALQEDLAKDLEVRDGARN